MQDTRNAAVVGTAATDKITFNTDYTTSSIESKEVFENNLSPVVRTPIRFRCNPNALPQTLKQMNNWVLSAWNKQPISPVHYCPTSPTDVSKAVPFQQAIGAMDIEKCMGVGFILSNNVIVVDVDSCLDEQGNPNELAQKLMNQLNTYVEYSQSKQGLHFIFKDNQASEVKSRKGVIEIYTKEHYFALTGWKVEGKPNDLQTLNGMSQELIDEYFPSLGYSSEVEASELIQNHTYTPVHSNEEILQRLEHDDKFQRLFYDGNIEGYPSQSEADGALMLKLAQATYLCAPQMRELFSQSALGKRNKWNDPWYQDYVISGAIKFAKNNLTKCQEVFKMTDFIKRNEWYTNNLKDYVIQEHNWSNRKSGFDQLDTQQAFKPGLYLLGGIPGMGKTSWSYQLGEQFASKGESVLFMSSEVDINILYMKSLVRSVKQSNPTTSMTPKQIKNLFNNATINSALKTLSTNNDEFFVQNTGNMSIELMINSAERFCKDRLQPIIIIDYLQYINTNKSFMTDKQRVDYIVHQLKEFQKSQQAMIILLSSFNRSNYRSSVSMESFKETGDIDGTADVMWGLQYDIYKDRESGIDAKGNKLKGVTLAEIREEQHKSPRQVMLSCIKNRFGNVYEVYFDYYSDYDLFVERESYENTFKLGC